MSRYQVILNTGEVINMPRDKARTKYEYISVYGYEAVLERVRRTAAYKDAVEKSDASIHAIVFPNGDVVTAF